MVRRSVYGVCLILVGMLVLAMPALAGGWAVVTLDSLPSEIQAGQTLQLGFMVRQHGITPVDLNPGENKSLAPFLSARNMATGEITTATARKEGSVGHYVVDVTFPRAGAWQIEITPPPFQATQLGTFTVAAASAKATNAGTTVPDLTTSSGVFGMSPLYIWSLSALVIVLALGLTAFVQREALGRLLAGGKTSPLHTASPSQRRVL